MRCDECRFWEWESEYEMVPNMSEDLKQGLLAVGGTNTATLGSCHRFPPNMPPDQEVEADNQLPWTHGYSWCGEFQAKEPEVVNLPELAIDLGDLSVRVHNFLYPYIRTWEGLSRWSEGGLRKLRNCGETSVAEIKDILRAHGLELSPWEAYHTQNRWNVDLQDWDIPPSNTSP